MLSAHRRKKHATFNSALPVNSFEFLRKQSVAPDEVFFHKYASILFRATIFMCSFQSWADVK